MILLNDKKSYFVIYNGDIIEIYINRILSNGDVKVIDKFKNSIILNTHSNAFFEKEPPHNIMSLNGKDIMIYSYLFNKSYNNIDFKVTEYSLFKELNTKAKRLYNFNKILNNND